MLGTVLSVVIPLVVVGYGVFLAVRLWRNRKRGHGCSGCAGCPWASECPGSCPARREEDTHG